MVACSLQGRSFVQWIQLQGGEGGVAAVGGGEVSDRWTQSTH